MQKIDIYQFEIILSSNNNDDIFENMCNIRKD